MCVKLANCQHSLSQQITAISLPLSLSFSTCVKPPPTPQIHLETQKSVDVQQSHGSTSVGALSRPFWQNTKDGATVPTYNNPILFVSCFFIFFLFFNTRTRNVGKSDCRVRQHLGEHIRFNIIYFLFVTARYFAFYHFF